MGKALLQSIAGQLGKPGGEHIIQVGLFNKLAAGD
jgi:hypothetical protein